MTNDIKLTSPWPVRLIVLTATIIVMCVIPMLFAAWGGGCTAPDRSRKALRNYGFTDVEIGGYAWFRCGNDDDYATEFRAIGPTGLPATGVVCCGITKACTVRLY